MKPGDVVVWSEMKIVRGRPVQVHSRGVVEHVTMLGHVLVRPEMGQPVTLSRFDLKIIGRVRR